MGETSDIGKTNKILVETIPNTICIGKPIQYIVKAKEPSTRIVTIVGTLALFLVRAIPTISEIDSANTDIIAETSGLNKNELKDFLKEQLRNAYDIKEAQVEQTHPGIMRQAERFFILQQLDTLWREHLQSMDSLRESVGLRGYGQKDPLIEYKNEGYDMFLDMMINMRRNVIYSMFMFQPAQKKVEA